MSKNRLATAVLLSEFTVHNNSFGHFVRRSLDMLAGVPSIVFGLFGNAFFLHLSGTGIFNFVWWAYSCLYGFACFNPYHRGRFTYSSK